MARNNLTDAQIEEGKDGVIYGSPQPLHQHNDCIRIAYEWLDAQRKISGPQKLMFPLKHLIEKWGGRYVSQSDVEVAAYLHPSIRGKYPLYNISARLTLPAEDRLEDIGEAYAHDNYREGLRTDAYSAKD